MSRATTHRSSQVAYDGEHLYTVSGMVQAAASTQRFGHFVAPCSGTIRRAMVATNVAPTNATSDLSLGTFASATSLLGTTDWQNHAANVVDVVGSLASATITEGVAYAWQFIGGDATGTLYTTLVIEPS